MISDSAFSPSSGQVLFYSPGTQDFTDSKTISFTGGPVIYTEDGERIYGAGIGFQAGNTSITHNDSGEYTIVYKIQKD